MAPNPQSRLNLKGAELLLLQAHTQGLEVLAQILTGFGAKTFHRCLNPGDAKAIVDKHPVDLLIVEGQLAEGEGEGFRFVKWLRRSGLEPNAYSPILMVSGHTSLSNVAQARDCGANFMITKPIVPVVLWERLLWMAQERRPFINAGDAYAGPERRFKNVGPPPGREGRRQTDLTAEVGEAKEANLSQRDLDVLIKPQKVIT